MGCDAASSRHGIAARIRRAPRERNGSSGDAALDAARGLDARARERRSAERAAVKPRAELAAVGRALALRGGSVVGQAVAAGFGARIRLGGRGGARWIGRRLDVAGARRERERDEGGDGDEGDRDGWARPRHGAGVGQWTCRVRFRGAREEGRRGGLTSRSGAAVDAFRHERDGERRSGERGGWGWFEAAVPRRDIPVGEYRCVEGPVCPP